MADSTFSRRTSDRDYRAVVRVLFEVLHPRNCLITLPPLHSLVMGVRGGGRTDAYHEWVLLTRDAFGEHEYFRPGEEQLTIDAVDADVCASIRAGGWHDVVVTGTRGHPRSAVRRRRAECVFFREPAMMIRS